MQLTIITQSLNVLHSDNDTLK